MTITIPDADPAIATVRQLGAILAARRISSVELAELVLARLSRLGPAYNAIASLLPERALAEARQADERRSRGRPAGPLLGIPYGAKDLLAARGGPTTWGTRGYADRIIDVDAAAIERLTRAGGMLAAKLALSELASFGTGSAYASMHGPGRNPWDTTRWAGGSSTGSAAVVAAGLLPFSLASETAGSIGSPSAYCGVTGLRPTYGLVSRFGAMPHSWTVDKIGVIARTADDCGLVLEAIAGGDRRDSGSANRTFRHTAVDQVRRNGLAGIRVGFSEHDFEVEAQPSIRPALRRGWRAIQDLGVQVADASLPVGIPYLAVTSAIVTGDVSSSLAPIVEREALDQVTRPEQQAALIASQSTLARDYLDAQRIRRVLQQGMAAIFERIDVLVSYTLPATANPIDVDFTPVPMTTGNTALIVAGNLAGLPALFVPVGLATDGLPVGMQMVGRPFSEATLLALGEAMQAATGWHTLRPPLPPGNAPATGSGAADADGAGRDVRA